MADAARAAAGRPLLKVKLGGSGDPERLAAIREAAPKARLIVDANEGWSPADFDRNMRACAVAGVALVEQPLPAAADSYLAGVDHLVPICADESLHVSGDLAELAGRYDAVNIKLDKTGGLTEALAFSPQPRASMAFASWSDAWSRRRWRWRRRCSSPRAPTFVDLDGPLLLARDRSPGLRYEGSRAFPPEPAFWG